MKVEAKVLLGLGAFFGLMFAVYWKWSNEDAGGVMMFGGMLLGFLPGGYYYWWSRRMKPRPEDNPNSTQAEGAGFVGTFPSSSIWPFSLGAGCFFLALSLAFGIWLIVPGIFLVGWAFLGGTAEGRRSGKH